MTINAANNNPRIEYTVGQGVEQKVFAIPFEFFEDPEVKLYVDGTLRTQGSGDGNYTVTGGEGSTGTATFNDVSSGTQPVTGISGGSTVIIVRDIPIERVTDFSAGADINRAALNTQLDTLTALVSDADTNITRSLTAPITDSSIDMSLPDKATRTGKALGFNSSTGNPEAITFYDSPADVRAAVEAASDSNVFTDADHSKLDGIEANATADQSAAEILTAVKTVDGASSGLDADLLDGQHGSYYTTYADNAVSNLVDSAPSSLDTLNELAAALNDDANFSTTVTNSIATKLPLAGGTMTGNIVMSGTETVDGRDLSVDGAKLDGIEDNATADQTAAEIRTLVESASDSNVFTDADHTKLNAIEDNATADQTAAEIRTLVESATDSNVFTDADHTKLNGIEDNATADQTASEILTAVKTVDGVGSGLNADLLDGQHGSYYETNATNVTAAGALMDSEVTNLAQVKAFDSSDYATAAQGSTADAAMPKAGGTFTGDVTILNTDGGSGRAPDFNLKRDSASPAAWDYLGAVRFLGEDGGSNETPYASILGRIVDPTSGSEDGRLEIWQQKAGTGTLTYVFEHDKFKLMNEQPIMWQDHHGTAYDVFVEPATPTADQTITLPNQTGTAMLWQSAWPDDTGTARNHAIGYQALNDLASGGEDNVAYGHQALEANTTGDDNVAIGNYALAYATTVSNNTAVGYAAGFGDTTQYGTFVGAYAGNYNVSSKDYQTAIGYNAMNDCSGDEVTAVGALSMSDGFHYQSVAVGMDALGRSSTANPYYNVAVGAYAGNSVYSGDHNTFLGYNTDVYTNSSSYSVAIGSNADISGNFSVAMGYNASASSIGNSDYCTFVGQSAGYDMDGGDQCTFIGSNAGYNGGTGSGNNSVGVDSLRSLSSGNHNNALGYWSLYDVTSGDYNSSLGAYSGRNVSTGSNNTFLGYNAGYWQDSSTINALTTGSNVTCVGFEAVPSSATATNEITLGDNDISSLRCNVQTISSLSDERDKTAIKDLTYGLDFINDMRPVEFTWNRRDGSLGAKPDMGFIAQDLYETELNHSSSSRTRLVNWENPEKLEADYVRSYPILVKAVQELSAQVTALQARIETLEGN